MKLTQRMKLQAGIGLVIGLALIAPKSHAATIDPNGCQNQDPKCTAPANEAVTRVIDGKERSGTKVCTARTVINGRPDKITICLDCGNGTGQKVEQTSSSGTCYITCVSTFEVGKDPDIKVTDYPTSTPLNKVLYNKLGTDCTEDFPE